MDLKHEDKSEKQWALHLFIGTQKEFVFFKLVQTICYQFTRFNKNTGMKNFIRISFFTLLITCVGCGEDTVQDENQSQEMPTFDSSTLQNPDTLTPLLNLDNPQSDESVIVLDSPGVTILSKDTNYRKPGKQ